MGATFQWPSTLPRSSRPFNNPHPDAPGATLGGRKLIITPEGSTVAGEAVPRQYPDQNLIRAHRWQRQIESGKAKSITDLAEQDGVTDAYV